MAKSKGIIKIEGTVEDLTFYKQEGVYYVRKKGGIDKSRIAKDANFVRTRENNSEFGGSGKSGKLLRTALGTMVFKAKDNRLTSRLLQVMSRVKSFDAVSARGNRNVAQGITTPEGKQALKGFDFNGKAELNSVLYANYDLDTTTGVITLNTVIPAEQILFPQGATHVSFQGAVLALDFGTEESEVAYSNIVNLPLNLTPTNITLTPTSVPTGTGQQFFLLMVSFYQQVNGVQYSLKNEEYNVLNIIEIV
ncbi:hypothetical protein LZZ90_12700 [Flavobacterium sp. SM15]|uniref:hypothetical protein n=1 Tax=Flavobacterium sp. SM15 TaxID=2908005 RepID=UPI001EDC3509|nr:hypothetical protein [Flavobacterium sp. SM15]MCG2612367.1 hypothetical protein [Flavobacterium sp. SM15]